MIWYHDPRVEKRLTACDLGHFI